MKFPLVVLAGCLSLTGQIPPRRVHVWEKQEVTLTARGSYRNAYTDVVFWVDLKGPGFAKRIYGFRDGGNAFRVRFLATAPGRWTWSSDSAPADTGLSGKQGAFEAFE